MPESFLTFLSFLFSIRKSCPLTIEMYDDDVDTIDYENDTDHKMPF